VLEDIDFRDVKFGGHVSFDNASFIGRFTWFDDALFDGFIADFSGAQFEANETDFKRVRFANSVTTFKSAEFNSEKTSFEYSLFRSSNSVLDNVKLAGKSVDFNHVRFICLDKLEFDWPIIEADELLFHKATTKRCSLFDWQTPDNMPKLSNIQPPEWLSMATKEPQSRPTHTDDVTQTASNTSESS
jgi:hypothetical protein